MQKQVCNLQKFPCLACKRDLSVLKSRSIQMQLSWGTSLVGPVLTSRGKQISATIQSMKRVIMHKWKDNRKRSPVRENKQRTNKAFIGFPVQSSLICLSRVGVLPANLVSSSPVWTLVYCVYQKLQQAETIWEHLRGALGIQTSLEIQSSLCPSRG